MKSILIFFLIFSFYSFSQSNASTNFQSCDFSGHFTWNERPYQLNREELKASKCSFLKKMHQEVSKSIDLLEEVQLLRKVNIQQVLTTFLNDKIDYFYNTWAYMTFLAKYPDHKNHRKIQHLTNLYYQESQTLIERTKDSFELVLRVNNIGGRRADSSDLTNWLLSGKSHLSRLVSAKSVLVKTAPTLESSLKDVKRAIK